MSRFFDPRLFAPAAVCALVALAGPAAAQEQTGTLTGTVTTPDEKPIAGAKVTLSGEANIGGENVETTGEEGEFRFIKLLPGEYKVTIEADGYEGLTTTLRVGIGRTARLTVPLKPAVGEGVEVIEVSAEKLTIDTAEVGIQTNFSAEFLQSVPTGRSYQSVTQFAPGVTGGGNPNINGGGEASNAYLIDGVNTTDPTTNTFGLNFNFDAIEELQVIPDPLHPRYGNVTGGVINVVTKSGGNEFSLDASVYYTGRLLQIDSPDEELLPDDQKRNFWDIAANINFGGPIIEDKLWYFVSTEYNYVVSQLPSGSPYLFPNAERTALVSEQHPERVYQSFYWLAKLTAQLDRNNRLTLLGIADPASIDNASQSASWAKESEYHQDQNGFTGKLDWIGNFDPLEVQVKVGYKRSLLDVFPQERVKGTSSPFGFPGVFGFGELSNKNDFGIAPGCLAPEDRADGMAGEGCTQDVQASPEFGNGLRFFANNQGIYYGGISYDSYIERQRLDATAEVSYYLDDALGDHKIDLGFELTFKQDDETERFPGGASVFLDIENAERLPEPYYARIASSDDNELTLTTKGQVYAAYLADRWQIDERFTLQPGVRVEQATHEDYEGNAVLDFFTVSPRIGFSVDPFATGRTRIHGGYARFYETGNLGLSKFVGTSIQTRLAFWDAEAGRYREDPGAIQLRGGAAGTTVDPDLQAMYADVFRLGIEQAIGDTIAVSALYTRKQTELAWEDDEINLIWDQAGKDIIGSRAGDGQQTYRLTSIEDARRTYDALQLSFNRGGADGFVVNGSYTLAWSRGTTSDTLTGAFDNPRQDPYLQGDLPDDIRHNFKAQGYYEWENGLRLGFAWRYETGAPYSAYYEDIIYQDFVLRRAPRGYHVGNDPNDPLDDRLLRLESYMRLDARVAWNLEPLIGQKLTFNVDIFNLLNQNTVTSVVTNDAFPDGEGNVPDTAFREPVGYQSPLRVQLGVRYQF